MKPVKRMTQRSTQKNESEKQSRHCDSIWKTAVQSNWHHTTQQQQYTNNQLHYGNYTQLCKKMRMYAMHYALCVYVCVSVSIPYVCQVVLLENIKCISSLHQLKIILVFKDRKEEKEEWLQHQASSAAPRGGCSFTVISHILINEPISMLMVMLLTSQSSLNCGINSKWHSVMYWI